MTNNNPNQLIPSLSDSPVPIWQQPEIIRWSQIMAESYQRLLGQNLIAPVKTSKQLAKALFESKFRISRVNFGVWILQSLTGGGASCQTLSPSSINIPLFDRIQ